MTISDARYHILYCTSIAEALLTTSTSDPPRDNACVETSHSKLNLHSAPVSLVYAVLQYVQELGILVVLEMHFDRKSARNTRIVSEEELHLFVVACQDEDYLSS